MHHAIMHHPVGGNPIELVTDSSFVKNWNFAGWTKSQLRVISAGKQKRTRAILKDGGTIATSQCKRIDPFERRRLCSNCFSSQ
jgi:hypothetical protein